MDKNAAFHALARDLFVNMGIQPAGAVQRKDALYTVRVDEKLEIHIVGEQEGFLQLWSSPCNLPDKPGTDLLMALLGGNHIVLEYPHINISTPPTVSRMEAQKLVVWTRQPLAELNADTLLQLFLRFVETAENLLRWIAQGASLPGKHARVPDTSRATSTAQMLTRRKLILR